MAKNVFLIRPLSFTNVDGMIDFIYNHIIKRACDHKIIYLLVSYWPFGVWRPCLLHLLLQGNIIKCIT